MRFTFDDCVLDTSSYQLIRSGEPVSVEPQVFEVLAHLVERQGELVSKNELLDAVWGDRFVSESALTSRIKAARRAVGDDGTRQDVIKTIHGRGYQFVAAARSASGSSPTRLAEPAPQEIRFCTSADGTGIAYACMGSGPPPIRAAHWITHVDYDWHSEIWRHWLEGFSRSRTFIRYDERGCGLSDHDIAEFTLDRFVEDLEAVVEATGFERFPLLGVSQGGAVAMAYADRHPERVTHLVLVNTYVEGRLTRASNTQQVREEEVRSELARVGWGSDNPAFRQFYVAQFIPDAPELWSPFSELLRRSTPARNAAELMDAWAAIDVRELAGRLRVPTLVAHARDEHLVPLEQSRLIASLIPGSRLVVLDSRNHLFQPSEPAWEQLLSEVDRFLEDT